MNIAHVTYWHDSPSPLLRQYILHKARLHPRDPVVASIWLQKSLPFELEPLDYRARDMAGKDSY